MIRILRELETYVSFLNEINQDPDCSDPHLLTEEQKQCNLWDAVEEQSDLVLGVFEGERMTGFFVFVVLPEERYLEMIVGLSRSDSAWKEILDLLSACYPGYRADFVFNPRNELAKKLLAERNAAFDTVQRRMTLDDFCREQDNTGILPLSEQFFSEYAALHSKDVYWTAEKVFRAPEQFHVFLAIEQGHVAGYVDFTHGNDENEIYDILVRESSRRRGWGRKLMAAALAENYPKEMLLFVDADNDPALRLYQALGFVFVPEGDNQTAFWKIPS